MLNCLQRVADVLLATETPATTAKTPGSIYLVREAFDVADAAVRKSLGEPISRLHEILGMQVREKSLSQLCDDERAADLTSWLTIYRVLQGTEFQSTPGQLDRRREAGVRPGPDRRPGICEKARPHANRRIRRPPRTLLRGD